MQLDSRNIINILIALFITVLLGMYSDLENNSIYGIGIFTYFLLKLYTGIGKLIDIRDIMIVLAYLQWIIGPILTYKFNNEDVIFFMEVEEATYMSYVLPATLALTIGLYLPIFRYKLDYKKTLEKISIFLAKNPQVDIALVIAGIVSYYASFVVPASLYFVFYLLACLRFVGVFFLLIGKRKFRWWIIIGVLIMQFSTAVEFGMFHDLVLWFSFTYIIIAYRIQIKPIVKVISACILILFVSIVQTVKTQFRAVAWQDRSISVYFEIVQENIDNEFIYSEFNRNSFIRRINQGWIISKIINYMPTVEPFSNGESIYLGLKESLLPRFLYDKVVFTGQSPYFTKYTGYKLARGTSMDLSVVGEAYANFGPENGTIFMFIFGLFFNLVLYLMLKISNNYPTVILWMPFIFLEVVKAENNFATSFNYFIKAIFFLTFFYTVLIYVFGINLKFSESEDS